MKRGYGTILVLVMATAVLLATALPCGAAEKEEKSIWVEDKPRQRRFELTEERIERIMNRLKEADPEKAKELEELRAKDPEKFKAELRKVMRERFGKRMREQMRRKDRAKVCPSMMPPGGPGGPGGFGGGRGGPMEMHERHGEYLEWLGKNYPEEAKKIADLEGKNPELYGRRIGLGFRKHRRILEAAKENPALAEVLKEDLELKEKRDKLLRKIRAASDDNEKKEMAKQLEEVVSSRFDLIVKRKQIEYEQMLKKLDKLKKRVEESESKVEKWKDAEFKNDSIKARLEELVGETDKFRW